MTRRIRQNYETGGIRRESGGKMRLFAAIRLDEEMRNALTDVQMFMKRKGIGGNYSPEENLHLTLAFIGEYGNPDDAADALQTVRFRAFPLKLSGLGSYETTWWAGVEQSDSLDQLASKIRRALAEARIPYDRKSFKPHITLIRRPVAQNGMPEIALPNAGMTVTEFLLLRSDPGKNHMIYTETGCFEAEPAAGESAAGF